MIVILWILIAFQVLSAIGSIALIDDPRKPKTKLEAIIAVVLSALMIIFYLWVINALKA